MRTNGEVVGAFDTPAVKSGTRGEQDVHTVNPGPALPDDINANTLRLWRRLTRTRKAAER